MPTLVPVCCPVHCFHHYWFTSAQPRCVCSSRAGRQYHPSSKHQHRGNNRGQQLFNWCNCLQERTSSACSAFLLGVNTTCSLWAVLKFWESSSRWFTLAWTHDKQFQITVTLLMSNGVTSPPVHGWTEHLSTACLVLSALPMSAGQRTINSILVFSGSDICLYDLGFTLNICMCNLAP